MKGLFHFNDAQKRDSEVEAWLRNRPGELGVISKRWFDVMRDCGEDVNELLHDGHPTACVDGFAFGYVNAFSAHVNVGFFRGAELDDPESLLVGTGKLMRHVKIRPDDDCDSLALEALIRCAYRDMRRRALGQ